MAIEILGEKMSDQIDRMVFKLCHQFSVRGIPARRLAQLGTWWMGINHLTTATAYNPDTNEIRIAMLVEAPTADDAIREANDQIGWFKQDAGVQQAEQPLAADEWPEWAEAMLGPLYYRRQHGVFPPTYRPSREPPPDLVAAARAMSDPARTAEEEMSNAESYSRRTSILERPAPAELYEALGQIAAHGAGLEQALGDLIAQLSRVNGQAVPGDPLLHYRGRFSDLIKRAGAAAVAATGYIGRDVLNATNTFLAQVDDSLNARNHFIHSQWWWYAEPGGTNVFICRRLPQSAQDADVSEWLIRDVEDIRRFASHFRDLDLQSRFLVARIMTLADRIQGREQEAGNLRAELDVSNLTPEERADILHRLESGRPPEGLAFLGPVTDVEQKHDTDVDSDESRPWIRIRPASF